MAMSTTFTQCAPENTKFGKITQIKGHFAVQGHLRSPILVPIESSYTASYIKTMASEVLRIKCLISDSARLVPKSVTLNDLARNLYRDRRAVPLQTFTTTQS